MRDTAPINGKSTFCDETKNFGHNKQIIFITILFNEALFKLKQYLSSATSLLRSQHQGRTNHPTYVSEDHKIVNKKHFHYYPKFEKKAFREHMWYTG